MGNPLISIIVTTFNRPSFLKETVRSLLNQTYRHFELLVVDNHSDVDVKTILNSFRDDRIRFFKNENRGIIAVNRNVGILKARGQMLAFCDDDDLWTPRKLESQIRIFNADRHIGVGSSERIITGGGLSRTRILKGADRGLEEILKGGPVPFSSLMVAQTGIMFSEDPHLRTVEDFDFQLRLVYQFKKAIAVVEEPLIYFRVHTSNNNRNRADRLNGIRVLRPFRKVISSDVYHHSLSRLFFLAGMLSLKSGERDAKWFIRKAVIFKSDDIKLRALLCLSTWPVPFWARMIRVYYFIRNTGSLVADLGRGFLQKIHVRNCG